MTADQILTVPFRLAAKSQLPSLNNLAFFAHSTHNQACFVSRLQELYRHGDEMIGAETDTSVERLRINVHVCGSRVSKRHTLTVRIVYRRTV